MTIIRTGNGDVVDKNNPLPTKPIDQEHIAPVSIQDRYTQTIQTHTGVTIGPNATNSGTWVDSHVNGSPLTYLGIVVNMTSGTGMQIYIDYSIDGVNYFANSPIVFDGTTGTWSTSEDIKLAARYFKIVIKNKDATNPKVTNAYAYLKA